MKIKLATIIITFLALSKPISAQTVVDTYYIMGRIIDSATQKPVEIVSVRLRNITQQAVKSNVTKNDGVFNFEKLSTGKYTITLVKTGYSSKILSVDIKEGQKEKIDMGNISMLFQNNQLKEVAITADKPLVKQEVDRLTYDLQSDPESKGSNVLEMMRKVPLLSVDGEDNVLLKGSTGYKILINGKPSSMMERNPKDILRSMPASTIEKIEVITSPPSKYDAEGLAGIINIITTKKIDNGYNSSINVNERFPVGGPGAGGSFTFKQGKFGLSASGGASLYYSPEAKSSNNMETMGSNSTSLAQSSIRSSESRNGYFGSELSFEIDSLNLISGQFNINGSRSGRTGSSSSILNTPDKDIGYNIVNEDHGKGKGKDAALNYQLGFKGHKSRLLTFSYRYYTFGNKMDNNLEISDRINYTDPDYRQSNEGSSSEQTFQMDYIHPRKKLNIEGGLKGILRNNKSDFQYLFVNAANGELEPDPDRTNKFDYNQNVFAAYNAYQYNLKDWGFKAGVRVEQTSIRADFLSTASHLERNYLNLVPSASILRKFKNMSSLTLAYSQRIQRPGINELNPFTDRSNPNYESSGNPLLRPSIRNDLKLGYSRSKKASVNLSLNYSFGNLIGPVAVYDPVNKITRTRPENTGKVDMMSTNFNLNYPVTKKLNLSLNSDIRCLFADILVNSELVKIKGLMAYGAVSGGYRFDNGWRFNANFSMNSAGISGPQGRSNAYANSSFSINKDIVKDKLSFSASSGNPFTKYRLQREKKTGLDFTQITRNQSYYRSYSVSLNYRFGKLKEAIKKNSRGIKNDDISSGGGL